MDWTWYLFGFKGRINRAKYWLAELGVFGCMALLEFLLLLTINRFFGRLTSFDFSISSLLVVFAPESLRGMSRPAIAGAVANFLFLPLFLWIEAALAVKRLHDRDRIGWWVVPFFVPAGLCGEVIDPPDSYWFLSLAVISGILFLWGQIELALLPGSRGSNRFGPDPLGDEQARPPSDSDRLRATTPLDERSEIEMVPHKAGPPPV